MHPPRELGLLIGPFVAPKSSEEDQRGDVEGLRSKDVWAAGGLDFEELAGDIATEVRLLRNLNAEIDAMEDRIEALYDEADPKGIVVSAPGIGVTLAAGILGRLGDPDRFANLAGVRSFTGIVPKIDQRSARDHIRTSRGPRESRWSSTWSSADVSRDASPRGLPIMGWPPWPVVPRGA